MIRKISILREFKNNKRASHTVKICLMLSLAFILVMSIAFASYAESVNKGLADNMIRLHVIANSDSAEDQALKIDVRDVIINYMKSQLKDSKDVEQTKSIINMDMRKIEEISRNEIARQGKDYTVKAMLGNYPFPTKTYGDVSLPAGYYEALRVIIGKGEGRNWWCVLFPPLCFVDASHGTVSKTFKQNLKNTLTEDEFNLITSESEDKKSDIPVKIRFKLIELFQDSKIKFTGMISRFIK